MSSPQPNLPPEVRIDKWLWAVRLFKTRSLATAACRNGHVMISRAPVKPSRPVQIGDIISMRINEINRTVKVLGLLEQRVGAKLVSQYLEDLTPAEEYLRAIRKKEEQAVPKRERGAGRPTKKDRRLIAKIQETF